MTGVKLWVILWLISSNPSDVMEHSRHENKKVCEQKIIKVRSENPGKNYVCAKIDIW